MWNGKASLTLSPLGRYNAVLALDPAEAGPGRRTITEETSDEDRALSLYAKHVGY